jgi:hypothetical protein
MWNFGVCLVVVWQLSKSHWLVYFMVQLLCLDNFLNAVSVGDDEDLDLGQDFGQGSHFRVISEEIELKISPKSKFFNILFPQKNIRGCFYIYNHMKHS